MPSAYHHSSLENRMYGYLTQLGYVKNVDYYEQHPYGRYVLDFAFVMCRKPFRAIDLEVDGLVWHSNPKQRKRDNYRTYKLMKSGWLIERVGEYFTIEDVKNILDKYGIKPSM